MAGPRERARIYHGGGRGLRGHSGGGSGSGIGTDFTYDTIWIPADLWHLETPNGNNEGISDFLIPDDAGTSYQNRRKGWFMHVDPVTSLSFFWPEQKQSIDWAAPGFMLRPFFTMVGATSGNGALFLSVRNLNISDGEDDTTTYPWSSENKYLVTRRSTYDICAESTGMAFPTTPGGRAYNAGTINAVNFRIRRDPNDADDTLDASMVFWGAALQFKQAWPSSTKWTAATPL